MSKRSDAIWAIVQHSGGGGFTTAFPTPGLETHKHIALSANELAMCIRIAQIYSSKTYSKDEILTMLTDGGITLAGGSALAYGATKVGHGLINELLNMGGPPAWAVKGLLAGSLTASVGFAFMSYCELRWGSE